MSAGERNVVAKVNYFCFIIIYLCWV